MKIRSFVVAMALLGGTAWAGAANAQQASLDCSGSNFCWVTSGPAYDTLAWSFDTAGTDALFPANCTNSYVCQFYCPRNPGWVTANALFIVGGQIVATATSRARCTAEPI
ncbi:hypothetical protein [Luteimonas huabeiensis]|uniref:hypothetical protein n=1 Tax=Luteimonas huabeiensis TaxID=1244513 RepID=UPI0005BA23F1|nr:hypothetical protein [Luteimonas huabeiensis]